MTASEPEPRILPVNLDDWDEIVFGCPSIEPGTITSPHPRQLWGLLKSSWGVGKTIRDNPELWQRVNRDTPDADLQRRHSRPWWKWWRR